MGKFSRTFCSAAILGGAAAATWNLFLDDRAKASLKRAVSTTSNLATHYIEMYMGSTEHKTSQSALEQNRAWIEDQWNKAGY